MYKQYSEGKINSFFGFLSLLALRNGRAVIHWSVCAIPAKTVFFLKKYTAKKPSRAEGFFSSAFKATNGSFFQGHLDVTAGAFFGTQAATLAKIQIKFISSGSLRFFNGVVRAIHVAIAAIKTEPAT